MTAVVTLSSGEKVEGTIDRMDDFVISLRLPDGTHRSFQTEGGTSAVQVTEFLIVFAYSGVAAAFIAPRLSGLLQFFIGGSPVFSDVPAVIVTVST